MPTPVMMSEVTNPHTKKVIASARVTGQTPGSGGFSGGRTVQPECDSGGIGFKISVAMRFFTERVMGLRVRNNGIVVDFTVPAGEQSKNSTEINQARRNPHQ